MTLLAIDPGLSGAYALLGDGGELLEAGDLPTIGEKAQHRIDGPSFAALVDRLQPASAVIEEVGAMPGNGVSSMFRFGRAVGAIEGILLGKGIPLRRAQPVAWKRAHGLLGKVAGSGEPSRQKAVETWPARAAEFFGRKKDHNRQRQR